MTRDFAQLSPPGAALPDMNAVLCPVCAAPLGAAADGVCPRCVFAQMLGSAVAAPSRTLGDYELLEELAHGAMGVVWRARQRSLNREVALKLPLAGGLAGETELRRFRAEAEAAASLEHPNIVPVHEVGTADGRHFLAMKLVPGGSLGDRLARGEVPRPAEAAALAEKIARAVHHAHQRGLLHRDLKPANILLDADGEPLVSDFGLARRIGDTTPGLTQSGAALGTPGYMAPEILTHGSAAATTASDVFSMGALLYALLSGRAPFSTAGNFDAVRAAVEQEATAPASPHGRVDRDLATICLKALEKEPARRYGSAESFADDLARWRRHEPVLARAPHAWERVAKWMRRRPALAALLAVTLVAAGISAAVWWKSQARVAQQAAITRENLYAADMLLSLQLMEAGDYDTAVRALERHAADDDLRGWEGRWLRARAGGQVLRRWQAHGGIVNALAYSPDGAALVSAGLDGTLGLWNAAAGTGRTLPGAGDGMRTVSLSFSSDGRWLAAGGDGHTHLRDAHSGDLSWQQDGYGQAFFAGPEQMIVAGGYPAKSLEWRNIPGGNVQRQAAADGYNYALSPDGRTLAENDREIIRLRDAASGAVRAEFGRGSAVLLGAMAFSPDSQTLAVCAPNDHAAQLWQDGKLRRTLSGHGGRVFGVAWSPDDARLATACLDQVVRVFSMNDEPPQMLRGHRSGVTCVAWQPGGAEIATGSVDGEVCVWPAAAAVEKTEIAGAVGPVAFSADDALLAVAEKDGEVALWNVAARRVVQRVALPAEAALAFSGERLAGVSITEGTAVLSQTSPTSQTSLTVSSPARHAVLSADGTLCLTGHADGTVAAWDTTTGALRWSRRHFEEPVRSLTLSADGRRALVRQWTPHVLLELDTADGRELARRAFRSRFIMPSAFHPQSSAPVTAGGYAMFSGTEQIRLWQPETLEPAGTIAGHRDEVHHLAFAPDGRTLASASMEGELLLWHWVTRRPLGTVATGLKVERLLFSPHGQWLAAVCEDGTVKLWEAP